MPPEVFQWYVLSLAGAFGLCVGSFLNVCIWRIPHEQSVVKPRSYCPKCRHQIRWFDNVPVLSYVLLGGKCRDCRAPVHWRYPFVELLTGALLVLVWWQVGASWRAVAYSLLVCALIAATFIDFDHQIIPDEITLPGIVVGIVFSMLCPSLQQTWTWSGGLWRSLLGVAVGGGSLLVMGMIGDVLFKRESMGGGDVKLLAMVGAFLGWKYTLLAFFVSPFFGLVGGLATKLRHKTDVVPYGPYLSIGSVIAMLWGDGILRVILGF